MSLMRPFTIATLLLAIALPSFAQRTTGTIVGVVTDESGALLPGATITIKGEAIVGTQTAMTGSQGSYRFGALPPGTYQLSFALSGFATLNRQLRVGLGSTAEENISLKVSQLAEEITVTGEAAVVDTTSNLVSTNYDKDWVRNAPVPRFTFFDLINAAPGVNQAQANDSRSTSLGSASSDNSYMLDGTDFTAPLTGAAWPWPNTDAVEEIEVLSLGAPAEYGNLQGAVFNVVTRMGSNTYHGDANFYFQSDGLTSRNTKEADDGGLPYFRDKYHDATFQLNGPILNDKLWFFASYQYQRNYESPAGVPKEFPNRFEADRVFGKLNWQINDKNKLQLAYHDDYYNIPCADNACNALTAPSTIKREHGHNPSPNATFTSVLSDKTFVEARVSGFYGKDHADPVIDSEPRVKPRFLDLDSGEVTGGIYSWYDGDVWKTAVSAKVSHFADHFLGGSHDFKFGVQWNDGGADYVFGYNDYIRTYGGVPGYGYAYATPFHQAGKTRGIGVFVDDSFRVNSRLSLNVGLRYDYNKASFGSYELLDRLGQPTGSSTSAVDKLFAWNSLSPRIGANWKLTADGRTVLKAHYGRYYRGVIVGEFDDVSPSTSPYVLFSGEYDEAGNRIGEEVIADPGQLSVDPDYKNPYTDQFIVGFERELAKNIGLSISYVHKRGRDYGGWLDATGVYSPVEFLDVEGADASGRSIEVSRLDSDPTESRFLLTNPTQMFSRFNGVTLQVQKRMSDNWQATASLVVSKAEGRIGSSLGSPTDEPTAQARRFGRNPNDYINTDGRLILDRPVTAKLQAVYRLPEGFLVGANYTYQQGRPWGRLVQLPAELVTLPTRILTEPLDGSRRVGSWNLLDIRLQKDFKVANNTTVSFLTDVLNTFNDNANDGIGDRVGTSDSFGLPTDFVFPRRLMLGAKLTF